MTQERVFKLAKAADADLVLRYIAIDGSFKVTLKNCQVKDNAGAIAATLSGIGTDFDSAIEDFWQKIQGKILVLTVGAVVTEFWVIGV
jgi:hypothetical protein